MKTLQIEESKARSIYKTASAELKVMLEDTFSKEFFLQKVTERIDGWNDMLAETGRPDIPEFSDLPEDLRDHFKKYYKVVVMTEAYNEGVKMDIYNKDKKRHYPYFATNGSPAGFRFYDSSYDSTDAGAGSGSRLSLKEQELSDQIGHKHTDIYREWLES